MVKKTVAVYDMDPTNAGVSGYYGDGDPFGASLSVPPMGSPVEFFSGLMLEGDPDAVVVDLPGDPLKKLGLNFSEADLVELILSTRLFGYEPVMLFPLTNKDASSVSLSNALELFHGSVFGVFLNEAGVQKVSLETGKAYRSYFGPGLAGDDLAGSESLRDRVMARGGIEFRLPELMGETAMEAVDQLRMPFLTGWPAGPEGEVLTQRQILSSYEAFLGKAKPEAGAMGARSCYTAVKQFLRAALPETERFALESIEMVSKIESQFGGPSKPVFMVFSGKGGEGKSFQTRLLADYLRRHWANGRTLAESPLP